MEYRRLKPLDIVRFAAPHTWCASVMPALFGGVLAFRVLSGQAAFPGSEGSFPKISAATFLTWALCLIAAVLMQCAVNTLNDYRDFIGGTDTKANSGDPADAVLVYNNIAPKSARALGVCFLLAAGFFGLSALALSAWERSGPDMRLGWAVTPLLIGVCGAAVIGLYSFGPKPLASLPLGEFFSGTVMGFGIAGGVFSVMTQTVSGGVFVLAIPFVLGIGLIMMTNNICDIERDSVSGRGTLPVLLGRHRARSVYGALALLWYISLPVLSEIFHAAFQTNEKAFGRFDSYGFVMVIESILLIVCLVTVIRLLLLPLTPETRARSMKSITRANIILGFAYMFTIAAGVGLY